MINLKRLLTQSLALWLAFTATGALALHHATLTAAEMEHERLQVRNKFQTPQEVVRYYVNRDASGFVWSGLLEAERKAFTMWKEIPEHESFYIAKKYEISAPRDDAKSKNTALIDVKYEVTAMSDAHGTRVPASEGEHKVTFRLQKVDGVWKIAKPDPRHLAPVVLESKFPSLTAQK